MAYNATTISKFDVSTPTENASYIPEVNDAIREIKTCLRNAFVSQEYTSSATLYETTGIAEAAPNAGDITLTLPQVDQTTPLNKKWYFIKKTVTGYKVTVKPYTGETIDSVTNKELYLNKGGETLILVANQAGDGWWSIKNTFRGCLVRRNASFALGTSGSWGGIDWNYEIYDTDAIHDNATNPSRLTVPTGVYRVRLHGQLQFAADTTGIRSVRITKDGATAYEVCAWHSHNAISDGSYSTIIPISTPVLEVTPGEYFILEGFQSSGDTLDTCTVAQLAFFAMEIIE